jgi:hypothetical protein
MGQIGESFFGAVDMVTAAIHEDRLWARCGRTRIAILQRGQKLEDAAKISNDILDGGPVLQFFETPYGLLAVGQGSAGIVTLLPDDGAATSASGGGPTPVAHAAASGGAGAGPVAVAPAPAPSIRLNGQSSYLVVKHNASLDITDAFTAELWVRLNSHNPGTPALMTRDNPDLGPWEMTLGNGRLSTKVADGNWSPTPPETEYGPLPLSQWLHLAMVYDTLQVRVYVNGKQVAHYAAPDTVTVTNNDLKIGRSLLNGQALDGLVREVRISHWARYSGDFTPQWRCEPDWHTVVLLHCDEAKGEVARDSSGNGNDAQIIDAQWDLP